MHFGGKAHDLFGKEVADMLAGNSSTNATVLNQNTTTATLDGNDGVIGKNPIPPLAPGFK
jgi:hypothetical protein